MKQKDTFHYLKEGTKVTRLLAGTVPMEMTVESNKDGLVTMAGGWTFDAETGIEIDHELGWGQMYDHTGSFLTKQ